MADGFQILTDDHRAVERLFETYRHDTEDSVAHEICEQLTVHTRIEESAGRIASTVVPGWYVRPAWLWAEPRTRTLDALAELIGRAP